MWLIKKATTVVATQAVATRTHLDARLELDACRHSAAATGAVRSTMGGSI
jgi:hypothetical protein